MKCGLTLFLSTLALLPSPTLTAQEALPAGTTLPVALTSSLNSANAHPGKQIIARLMQAVSVAPRLDIPAGARVVGRIVQIQGHNLPGAQMSLRFDRIVVKNREIPFTAGLRAVASFMEVSDAGVPTARPDEGTSSNSQATVQVGGDVRYGAAGAVMAGGARVGQG